MKVGILGLGIIGRVWAGHYHAAGALAGVWNRTPDSGFPHWLNSPLQVCEATDVVQIVVSDPAAVRSLISALLPALVPGKIIVQSSTIDPQSSSEFASVVTGRGARYVAAPFTGSKPAAEQRQTVFYLGGEQQDLAAVDGLLGLVSAHRFVIGTNEQACTLKLAMNLHLAAQMQGLCEALTLARRAGVADAVFFSAMAKNVGCSGLTQLKEPKLRARDFTPQFSVKHLHKDLRLTSAGAGEHSYPMLAAVQGALAAAEACGLGDDDFSSLINVLEQAPSSPSSVLKNG